MKKAVKFSLKQIIDCSDKAIKLCSVGFGDKSSLQTDVYCFKCKAVTSSRIIIDYSKNSIEHLMCIKCYCTGKVTAFGFTFPGDPAVSAFCIKDEYFISFVPEFLNKEYWERRNVNETKTTLKIFDEKFNEHLIEFIQNIMLLK